MKEEEIKTVHRMNLQPGPFAMIKSGKKDVEMRLNDERRKNIFPGDIIIFAHTETGEELVVEVLRLKRFSNFEQLYRSYPKTRLGYLENEEANPNDMAKYYDKSQMEKYGALAIEIALMK